MNLEQLANLKRDYYEILGTCVVGMTLNEAAKARAEGIKLGCVVNPGIDGHSEYTVPHAHDRSKLQTIFARPNL